MDSAARSARCAVYGASRIDVHVTATGHEIVGADAVSRWNRALGIMRSPIQLCWCRADSRFEFFSPSSDSSAASENSARLGAKHPHWTRPLTCFCVRERSFRAWVPLSQADLDSARA